MRRTVVAAACAAMLCSASCVEKADHVSAVDRKAVQRFITTAPPPPPAHRVDGQFGEELELLGYDVAPEQPSAGKSFTITWHWKVNKKVGAGWKLFTHVADAEGRDRFNQDAAGPVRRAYQPGAWRGGEYIRDPQTIRLPEDWDSPAVMLYLGVWKDDMRQPVTKGPQDGTHRLRAATLKVKNAKPESLPELVALKAKAAPKLDGKLDDAVWKQSAQTEQLVNTLTGAPTDPASFVRAAWDDSALYLAFEVADTFLKSSFEADDDHLWEQDCVEVMVDPDGDGRNYFELQVSPRGKVFDTRYDSRRRPKPFGHVDWNTELKNGVELHGKVDDDEDDEGYTVEMAIPWKAFAAGSKPAAKPKAGESWRVNFYVLDALEDGHRGAGWSAPKVGDYHVPARFGHLRFEAPGEDKAAKPSTDPSPAETPKP